MYAKTLAECLLILDFLCINGHFYTLLRQACLRCLYVGKVAVNVLLINTPSSSNKIHFRHF